MYSLLIIGLIIGAIFVLLVIIFAVHHKIRSVGINSRSAIVDQVYGTEKLLSELGWSKITYPIIGFSGDFAEPMQVHSIEEYQNDYLYGSISLNSPTTGLGADYIIDSKGKKYLITKKNAKEIGIVDNKLGDLIFENLQLTNIVITIDELKQTIISSIQKTEDSVYAGLEKEIESSQSVDDIAKVMDKGVY